MKASVPILIILALLLSAASGLSGKSPHPSPSPSKTTQTNQQQSKGIKADAYNQPKSTAQPITAINQARTPLGAPPSDGDGQRRGEKSSSDCWLIAFTAALALVGVAQFCAMLKQAAYMRRANALTRGNLKISIRNANAAKESAETAAATLALTQRAHVQFSENVGFEWSGLEPIECRMWIVNWGNTAAHIKRCEMEARLTAETPTGFYVPSAIEDAKGAPDLAILAAQQSRSKTCLLTPDMRRIVKATPPYPGPNRLWFYGFVTYIDEFAKDHVTVWCRYWIPGQRFERGGQCLAAPDDPSLNYAT